MDALLPVPTPGIYVGTLLFVGLLAFVLAVGPFSRRGLALLFVLYTYAWTMSMLDSYQHHYLISLLLFSCIFFPAPSINELAPTPSQHAEAAGGLLLMFGLGETVMGLADATTPLFMLGLDGVVLWSTRIVILLLGGLVAFLPDTTPDASSTAAMRRKKRTHSKAKAPKKAEPAKKHTPTLSAWGYVSFATTCAIVYFYTAITKTAPDWREGHALRRLGRSEAFVELQNLAISEGLPLFGVFTVEGFWEFMALGAIGVQLVTFTGFLITARQDSLQPTSKRLAAAGTDDRSVELSHRCRTALLGDRLVQLLHALRSRGLLRTA